MKKKYIAPLTEKTEVEMEQGFMSSASIFDEENGQDDGVTTSGHGVGNTGDYTDIGWDSDGNTRSTWGN